MSHLFPNSMRISLMSFTPTVHVQFSSAWSFLQFSFFNVLFQLLVISTNQLPVFPVRHWCHIFPIWCQLIHSYNLHQLSYSQFSSSWLFLFPFAANFLYYQFSLTFPWTLCFPESQSIITRSRLAIIDLKSRDLLYLSVTSPRLPSSFIFTESSFFTEPTRIRPSHTSPFWTPYIIILIFFK